MKRLVNRRTDLVGEADMDRLQAQQECRTASPNRHLLK
jgi:hypothetical protein